MSIFSHPQFTHLNKNVNATISGILAMWLAGQDMEGIAVTRSREESLGANPCGTQIWAHPKTTLSTRSTLESWELAITVHLRSKMELTRKAGARGIFSHKMGL